MRQDLIDLSKEEYISGHRIGLCAGIASAALQNQFGWGSGQAQDWLRSPHPFFKNKSPQEIILDHKGHELLQFLGEAFSNELSLDEQMEIVRGSSRADKEIPL